MCAFIILMTWRSIKSRKIFFEFQLKHFNHQVETIDDINVWKKISFELFSILIHWRNQKNVILILIHWLRATEKQQIHRIFIASIDRLARRMRDLHRDKDFNNALNRVKNTLLKLRARITAHRHWRFHDLTSEEFYYKKMIFALIWNMQKTKQSTKFT